MEVRESSWLFTMAAAFACMGGACSVSTKDPLASASAKQESDGGAGRASNDAEAARDARAADAKSADADADRDDDDAGDPKDASDSAAACVVPNDFLSGSSACRQCTQDECCTQITACSDDPDCMGLLQCELGCILSGKPTCGDDCQAAHPGKQQVIETMHLCQVNNCQQICL